jgi:hypothetical protein
MEGNRMDLNERTTVTQDKDFRRLVYISILTEKGIRQNSLGQPRC